jgi:hypothetical protein
MELRFVSPVFLIPWLQHLVVFLASRQLPSPDYSLSSVFLPPPVPLLSWLNSINFLLLSFHLIGFHF